MKKFLLVSILPLLICVSCTTTTPAKKGPREAGGAVIPLRNVRTTAYTHTEAGGGRDALGARLSSGAIKSAAADWSRFPVGTRFRILTTQEVYEIDDYGSALVGTSTIDLYKPSRRAMRDWGVRHVEIQILRWGSREQSRHILAERAHCRYVRKMVASLTP